MNSDIAAAGENQLVDAIQAEEQAEAQRAAEAQRIAEEEADCNRWLKAIKEAREFDKPARERYAEDRKYCRGAVDDDVFTVSVNIAGTYVDLLTAFLYARDPETSVQPAESAGARRKDDAKQFAKTLEIVIASLWRRGKLKAAADDLVRSGLTVGIGWMKAAWHRRMGNDPTTERQINDLRDNLQRLELTRQQMGEDGRNDTDAIAASYRQQMQGLEAQVEVMVYNGLVIDFVRADDVQVSTEAASLKRYVDAPWIAGRTFMPVEKAKAQFQRIAEKIGQATLYFPASASTTKTGFGRGDASEDEQFTQGAAGKVGDAASAHVCIWELWDRETSTILTLCEGLKQYAVEPYNPEQASTRFYPFFQWAPLWVDGDRHPQSLVSRSRSLLDEYNRIRTNYRDHRRRAIPKMGFDSGAVSPEEAKKMEAGVSGEMVGLNLQGQSSQNVLFPIQYNQVDHALYDTAVIRSELEMIWGVQEALSSSIRTAKTATEAEIQQTGTESRTGYMRASLDETLSDLAEYTAEVSTSPNGLTHDGAVDIAGPDALWVEAATPDDLQALVAVSIRAGSSGRPNTSMRQQQWTVLLPQLQQAAEVIGQLRGASPLDIANCIEQLAVETVERAGDVIDPYLFIPQVPQPSVADPVNPEAAPGDPTAGLPPDIPPGMPGLPAGLDIDPSLPPQ